MNHKLMTVHIIIDGYNLIRQSRNLKHLDQMELELGRDALIRRLAAYKKIKGHCITVVFDGRPEFSHWGSERLEHGIRIKFSQYGETADSVIKQMAAKEREKALIVSSDNEIIRFCETTGAAVIRAQEFDEKMALAVLMDIKGEPLESGNGNGWTPTTRKKGQAKKMSKKARRTLNKFRKL